MIELATRQSQSLRAALWLRELILRGELVAGRRIAEPSLARRLGLSRTPLRLALGRLEQEGLVTADSSGAFRVRSFTLADVASAIAVRGALEGVAAGAAAERFTHADGAAAEALYDCVARLDALLAAPFLPEQAFERYVALNERFHALLLDVAGSEVLRQAVESAAAQPFASPSGFLRAHAVLPESQAILRHAHAQHRAMLGALVAGDAGDADRLARTHAHMALGNLHVALQEPPPPGP